MSDIFELENEIELESDEVIMENENVEKAVEAAKDKATEVVSDLKDKFQK